MQYTKESGKIIRKTAEASITSPLLDMRQIESLLAGWVCLQGGLYEGEWLDGNRNGIGIRTFSDGRMQVTGMAARKCE